MKNRQTKDKCRTAYGFRVGNDSLLKLSVDLYRYFVSCQLCTFYIIYIYVHIACRSTPVEMLHTILLGLCKYMLKSFMGSREKQEILARIASLSSSGLLCRITGNIAYHYQSFVGRDYKFWMQIAVFIVHPYLSENRFESFNSMTRAYNIYSNHRSPSRDIAVSFAIIAQFHYICSGGRLSHGNR